MAASTYQLKTDSDTEIMNTRTKQALKQPQFVEDIRKDILELISKRLTPTGLTGLIKGAALTETLLGHFRDYKKDIFSIDVDFEEFARKRGYTRAESRRVAEAYSHEFGLVAKSTLKFESILTDQLKLVTNLSPEKQETLHEVDEAIYNEQELMAEVRRLIFVEGKRAINVNQVLKRLNIESVAA